MENKDVVQKTASATRWSTITEVVAKLISPITNMILARLLTPEAFGVVATINMVVSFVEMFTDAGFQKYIIQHVFASEEELDKDTTVAFWTNLGISVLGWLIIAIFGEDIADLVGNPGLGNVITVAAASLPLTSFSSIQMARYKRSFDFKTLFYVRLIAVCVPLVVTVPAAIITRSYWALVIGTIAGNLANSIVLTARSQWKPNFYFSFARLKKMFMYSCWVLLESISVWLTSYIGTFIVGRYLSTYYLGLYKTSMTTTNQIISLITASTSAPLFTALSKLQNNDKEFKEVYFKYIQAISVFVVPLGIGMFLYKDLLTLILLGDQWGETADFIGLWSLMSVVCLIWGTYCSGVYNAKGKPILSFIAQMLHLVVLVPVLIFSSQRGFTTLYISRSLVRLEFVLVQMIIMKVFFGFFPWKLIVKTLPAFAGSAVMVIVSLLLQQVSTSILWQILSIVICIFVYFGTMRVLFKDVLSNAFSTLGFDLMKMFMMLKKKIKKEG
ncbi:MAG: lipopolysaccharide biosynthesis protein [Ruminococcus sp.]